MTEFLDGVFFLGMFLGAFLGLLTIGLLVADWLWPPSE